MRQHRILIIAALLAALPSMLPAQNGDAGKDSRTLAIEGISQGGLVRLRWATGNTVVWNLIHSGGVRLTRQASNERDTVLLGGGPLRVWNDAQWRAHADIPGAGQAVQLLHDDPKDRAGLTDYAQADLEQNKLTGLLLMAEFSYDLARGLALAYTDSGTVKGALYRYEVLVPDPVHGDTLRAECFVESGQETTLPPVTGVRATTGDSFIDLFWDRQAAHAGYHVERTEAGKAQWQRLTKVPLIFANNFPERYLYRDSVANGRTYEYRVVGVDVFAREVLSLGTATAEARDLTPPEPPYDLQWKLKDNKVLISWKNPPAEPDLAGYAVLRSRNPELGFAPLHNELLTPGTTTYSDAVPAAGTYFYRLIASDKAGNVSSMSVRAMAVIDDTIPPPPPTGLTALADTTGVITIRWRMQHGDDVAGYRVYRIIDGGRTPEYVPLTRSAIVDTVWADTLMADVRDRFLYRVRSVDFAGNYSAPSTPVSVRFPDRTPPVRPIIERSSVQGRSVELAFVSPSTDVAAYIIRRAELENRRSEISVRTTARRWSDSTAKHGVMYVYTVAAADSAGNISAPSDPLHVQPFWTEPIPVPAAPVCTHDAAKKHVTVAWTYPKGKGWTAIVFRRIGTGALLQLSPQLTVAVYVDTHIASGAYEYAVKFYLAGEGGSEMGAAARVLIP